MTRKHIVSFLTAIAANIIGFAFAQGAGQVHPEIEIAYSKPRVAPETTPLHLNEVHTKALRSFAREYKDNTDAKWYTSPGGFTVYFTDKKVRTKIFYDKRGNHRCTVRNYDETVLPREVRHEVKSHYYDYNIYHVIEMTAAGATAYIIKLEGKESWIDLRVQNNEIEIIKEFNKR